MLPERLEHPDKGLDMVTITVRDPRLPPVSTSVALAPRDAHVHEGPVILYDNGKLAPAFGNYAVAFEVIEARLEAQGVPVLRDGADLLAATLSDLEGIADAIARRSPAGVVLGVCDTGVSMPTTILAAALEARSVPTSIVGHGIGAMVARATLQRLLPGVPIHRLVSDRTASAAEVRRELEEGVADDILQGLRADPDQLVRRFEADDAAPAVGTRPADLLQFDAHDGTGEGADATGTFTQLMAADGLGDGLPLTPPTIERVATMVTAMGGDAGAQVWPSMIPRMAPVLVEDIAVVAVMAGCTPEVGPLVHAAYRAMAADEFRLFQAAITTHPAGTLVLVSGPGAEQAGLASGPGALGPGFASNVALGRAVALSYNALLGLRPGGGDLSSQGSPAELTYCVAEATTSPWPGHHVVVTGSSSETVVTVLKCEGPHNVLDNVSTTPEGVLASVAAVLHGVGRNNSYVPGAQTVVFLNPEHAAIVAAEGWSKDDTRRFLYEHARSSRDDLLTSGITPIWPPWIRTLERVPIAHRPEDIIVVVVGGTGPQSSVALPWGYSRGVTITV